MDTTCEALPFSSSFVKCSTFRGIKLPRSPLQKLCTKMQRTVAPPNCATFLYFNCHLFGCIADTRTAYGGDTVIIIGDESGCFGLRAADFEIITAHGNFQPSKPDWLDPPREEKSQNKSHGNPSWFEAAPG